MSFLPCISLSARWAFTSEITHQNALQFLRPILDSLVTELPVGYIKLPGWLLAMQAFYKVGITACLLPEGFVATTVFLFPLSVFGPQ